MTVLRLEDVWFSYGTAPVLRAVSCAVRAGETVALLGRNGAGKTTLTKLVVGLLHPRRGAVQVGARTTTDLRPEDLCAWTAYVFQHPEDQLFARSVLEEVTFAPRQRRDLGAAEVHRIAGRALARVGLEDAHAVHPYDLSPPDRKLVTLAAALAQDPRILVLDEPTQGLGPEGAGVVARILGEVAGEGKAVLAVSHDLGFAVEALGRSLVLAEGTLAYDGPTHGLVRDAARLEVLALEAPPAARLSAALGLPGAPVTRDDVAAALARRCRGAGGPGPSGRREDDQS